MADEPGDEPPAEKPKYDQDFFLALAAMGKDAWNAWRRDPAHNDKHNYVCVTFAGIDFSEAPKDGIDFSGFEFGHHANFSGCKWRGSERWKSITAFTPGRAYFYGAVFGDFAQFTGAAFGDQANFIDAAFGDRANFANAGFGELASFAGAAFGYGANFTYAPPNYLRELTKARFYSHASFRATFDKSASYNGAAFGSDASFDGAVFGSDANFAFAAFDRDASFDGAVFGSDANFTGAAFGDKAGIGGANFSGAVFGDSARFVGADIGYRARFDGAAFGRSASFTGAAFGDKATLASAAFGDMTDFDCTIFRGRAAFTGKSKVQSSKDLETNADEKCKEARVALVERHKVSWTSYDSGPDRFVTISFSRARFDGETDFSGRTFERTADFSYSRFYYPPDFDTAANAARINFTGANISFVRPGHAHWTFQPLLPVRLRALRKIAEDTKNHDLERDLYIEERKAERGVYLVQWLADLIMAPWKNRPRNAAHLIAHILWIAVMGVYWALADYGRSFARPAAWLILSGFFFYWCYGRILAPLMPKANPLADKYEHALGMVALGNAVPFVGPLTIDTKIKEFLFCPNNAASCLPAIPPEGFQFLVIAQNLLSIILVFFIVLALRNYFRIK